MCVRDRERSGKIRNRKEEKGCWGASGVALYVNQKHKVLPPQVYYHRCRQFGVTRGAAPTHVPHRLLPTDQQSFSPRSFNVLVNLNGSQHHRPDCEPSSSQCRTPYLPCSLTDRFRALCCIYREGRYYTVPYLGSHGPLCLQLLLQLLNTSLRREKLQWISVKLLKEQQSAFTKV